MDLFSYVPGPDFFNIKYTRDTEFSIVCQPFHSHTPPYTLFELWIYSWIICSTTWSVHIFRFTGSFWSYWVFYPLFFTSYLIASWTRSSSIFVSSSILSSYFPIRWLFSLFFVITICSWTWCIIFISPTFMNL